MEKLMETKENAKVRFSGVELLRILAIFLICTYHAIQTTEGILNYSQNNFGMMILKILSYAGKVGNLLFIICSSYFLLESTHVKKNKVLKILFDSMLISIIIFLFFVFFGHKFTYEEAIKHFFPDYYQLVWFVPFYCIFYLIHPLLNIVINNISQKQHFSICLFIFFFYGFLVLFFGFTLGVNILIYFVFIYFVVAYMKKYCSKFCENRKLNALLLFIFTVIFILLIVLKNLYQISWLFLDEWCSPILLPLLLFLFNIFNSFKFKNKTINYLASCSLFVYCIHENFLLRRIIRPKYYKYVLSISQNMYFWWIMLCAVGMFIGAYILSLLYKLTLSKLTNFLSKKAACGIDKIIDFLFSKTKRNE